MSTNIIGLHGRIGHGKDEVAKIIQYLTFKNSRKELNDYCTYEHFKSSTLEMLSPWQNKKMAYKLKQIASILLNVPVAQFEDRSFKDSQLGDEWDNMTVRTFLQRLGTEAMRNGLHTNTWANAFWGDFKEDSHWIITDVRFPNEYLSVKERNGILIKIERDNIPIPENEHSSETALDGCYFDYLIKNNKGIDELIIEVEGILKDLSII